MVPTSRPIAPRDRIAVSRPEPGPLTNTSIFFMPWSIARRPAAPAGLCAGDAGGLGGHLRGERRGLAGALEADGAGGGPRDHRPGRVGDGDDGVVERALDVSLALDDVLLLFTAHLLGAGGLAASGRHVFLTPKTKAGLVERSVTRAVPVGRARGHLAFFLPATVRLGPLRVRALVLVRWPRTGRPWR